MEMSHSVPLNDLRVLEDQQGSVIVAEVADTGATRMDEGPPMARTRRRTTTYRRKKSIGRWYGGAGREANRSFCTLQAGRTRNVAGPSGRIW
jgi:hypothetical protein